MDDNDDDKPKPKSGAAKRAIEELRRSGSLNGIASGADLAKIIDPSGIHAAAKAFDASGIGAAVRALDTSGFGAAVKAMDASGIGSVAGALEASSIGSTAKALEAARITTATHFDNGLGSAMKAIAASHFSFTTEMKRLVEAQTSPYRDFIERYRESTSSLRLALERNDFSRSAVFANVSQLSSALTNLDLGRYQGIFETLRINDKFGIDNAFAKDFLSVSTRLTSQLQALRPIGAAQFDFGLSGNIEELLARSLKVQEAMLAEQREAGGDAKAAERFQRRMAYFTSFIAMLTFFWMIALDLENRFQVDDVDLRPDPSEFVQMREAFETMSAQLEALQNAEEEESEREAAADAELADIMRGIAGILKEQTGEAKSPKDDGGATE